MKKLVCLGVAALAVVGLSGCTQTGPNQTSGALLGAVAGGLLGSTIGHGNNAAINTVAGAVIGGVIGGSLGAQLDEADRQAAYDAEFDAVAYGRRRSWRGPHGAYGYVDPGPEVYRPEGYCREYTQTIYIDGRPRSGHGLACHEPDGTWRIVS